GIAPLVLRLEHDRGVLRRSLGAQGQWIGLQPQASPACSNLELVPRAGRDPRHEYLPDAGSAERAHRMQTSVPAVEVADHADRARVRRPGGEGDAGDAVDRSEVRTEPGVKLLVPSLAGQVDVEIAERRQERVRITEDVRVAGRIRDLQLVGERQLGSL